MKIQINDSKDFLDFILNNFDKFKNNEINFDDIIIKDEFIPIYRFKGDKWNCKFDINVINVIENIKEYFILIHSIVTNNDIAESRKFIKESNYIEIKIDEGSIIFKIKLINILEFLHKICESLSDDYSVIINISLIIIFTLTPFNVKLFDYLNKKEDNRHKEQLHRDFYKHIENNLRITLKQHKKNKNNQNNDDHNDSIKMMCMTSLNNNDNTCYDIRNIKQYNNRSYRQESLNKKVREINKINEMIDKIQKPIKNIFNTLDDDDTIEVLSTGEILTNKYKEDFYN